MKRHSKKKTEAKKIIALGDLHCGHMVGLTHPDYQLSKTSGDKRIAKTALAQSEMWDFYESTIKEIGPVDLLIVNGDAIDGDGVKSGGTELITTDRMEQVDMAYAALSIIDAKKVHVSYGTGYHTGNQEDFENILADKLDASIRSHEWIDVNGTIFDVRHHVGSSSVPTSRHNAIAREHLWNQLWSDRGKQPRGDIVLRSHVHYHYHGGDGYFLGMTLPALQGMGSKFGSRRCTGTVDFGLVEFTVQPDGSYSWKAHLQKVAEQVRNAVKL